MRLRVTHVHSTTVRAPMLVGVRVAAEWHNVSILPAAPPNSHPHPLHQLSCAVSVNAQRLKLCMQGTVVISLLLLLLRMYYTCPAPVVSCCVQA